MNMMVCTVKSKWQLTRHQVMETPVELGSVVALLVVTSLLQLANYTGYH